MEKGKDTDTESLAPSIASNSGAVTPAISEFLLLLILRCEMIRYQHQYNEVNNPDRT